MNAATRRSPLATAVVNAEKAVGRYASAVDRVAEAARKYAEAKARTDALVAASSAPALYGRKVEKARKIK